MNEKLLKARCLFMLEKGLALGAHSKENVLIISDSVADSDDENRSYREVIAKGLEDACTELNIKSKMKILTGDDLKRITDNGQELKKYETQWFSDDDPVDVVIFLYGKSHTPMAFRHMIIARNQYFKTRIVLLPNITLETFCDVMDYNIEETNRLGEDIFELLLKASKVRVKTKNGTDITLKIDPEKFPPIVDGGWIILPNSWGNLPGGETYIVPVYGTAEGTVCIDASIDTHIVADNPVTFKVENGLLLPHTIKTKDEKFKRIFQVELEKENAEVLAEFGIGVNKGITKLTEIALINEKMSGTAHFGFGDNVPIGGTTRSAVHMDMVFFNPTIELDGRAIFTEGDVSYKIEWVRPSYKDVEGSFDTDDVFSRSSCSLAAIDEIKGKTALTVVRRGVVGSTYSAVIADEETSTLAADVWKFLSYTGERFSSLKRKTNLSKKTLGGVLQILSENRLIDVIKPNQ